MGYYFVYDWHIVGHSMAPCLAAWRRSMSEVDYDTIVIGSGSGRLTASVSAGRIQKRDKKNGDGNDMNYLCNNYFTLATKG